MLPPWPAHRPLLHALLALGLLFGLLASPRAVGQAERSEPPLLVRLPDEIPPGQAAAYLAALGLEALEPIPRIHVWRARPFGGRSVVLQTLRARLADRVLWIEQDGLVYAQEVVPNDPAYLPYQWNLPRIGLERAWSQSKGGQVLIAIIDSGLELAHPDLQARLWVNPREVPGNGLDDDGNGYVDDIHGWDFVGRDGHPQDEHGHGTHVAGIAGAHTDNGIGVAGAGWDVRLMSVRVLDQRGLGTWSDVAAAIIYAADNGARILNLSLGSQEYSESVLAAVRYARDKGSLVVAAAGNAASQATGILYPAAFEEVLAVGATTSADEPVLSWRRGPEMDVAAPGVGIYSTYLLSLGSYLAMSGTSMATPHVAGVAALLWAYEPGLTAARVTHVITSTATDVYAPGWDEHTGWGLVNAHAALSQLAQGGYAYRYSLPLLHREIP